MCKGTKIFHINNKMDKNVYSWQVSCAPQFILVDLSRLVFPWLFAKLNCVFGKYQDFIGGYCQPFILENAK